MIDLEQPPHNNLLFAIPEHYLSISKMYFTTVVEECEIV